MKLHQLFEEDKAPVKATLPSFKRGRRGMGTNMAFGRVGETFPITYAELNAVFGKAADINGDKTSTEWAMQFSNGAHATIYDYKETSVYSKGLPSPAKFRKSGPHEWGIGGDARPHTSDKNAVTLVYATIFKHWPDDKIMKLALKMLKEPEEFRSAVYPGYEKKEVQQIITAARMAGKDNPEFAAIEKSLGK